MLLVPPDQVIGPYPLSGQATNLFSLGQLGQPCKDVAYTNRNLVPVSLAQIQYNVLNALCPT